MGFRARQASLLLLLIIPVVLSVIALSIGNIDSEDLSIRMNTEYLMSENSVRMTDSFFDGRPVMRLQGFELLSMIMETIGSWTFTRIFMMISFSLSVLLVYLISLKTTQSPAASWFAVLLASTSPIVLKNALSYNELLFSIPIILFITYLFVQKRMPLGLIIFSFALLTLLNFSSVYLLVIMILYYLIMNATGTRAEKNSYEAFIISSFVFIGILTLYMVLFQDYNRIPVFYNNMPTGMLMELYSPISLVGRLLGPGLLVIFFAALGSYHIISRANEKALLPFSMLIGGSLMSLFFADKMSIALFAMGAFMVAGHGISMMLQWLSISKAAHFIRIIFIILALVIAGSGITQSIIAINDVKNNFASDDELRAYDYISNLQHERIFTTMDKATRTAYYTGKNVFINDDFRGIYDSNYYYNKYVQLLNSRSTVEALMVLREENIGILLFREDDIPFYLQEDVIDYRCFTHTIFGDIHVYEVICEVRS